jgi:hypothetical protein
MNRVVSETRGVGSWRDRLASPDRQWKRYCSAFETAVSWETAQESPSGLPAPLEKLLRESSFDDPVLLLAIAEHKVDLPGGVAASQSDVWAVIRTATGLLSLTVEAKAQESFGDEVLEHWLVAGKTARSIQNRRDRWDHVRAHLPESKSLLQIRYQMLHRCAAAVIEARRVGCPHAAFVVQAFETPDISFRDYERFCDALELPASRGGMARTLVGQNTLSIGWIDCPVAADAAVAACA